MRRCLGTIIKEKDPNQDFPIFYLLGLRCSYPFSKGFLSFSTKVKDTEIIPSKSVHSPRGNR